MSLPDHLLDPPEEVTTMCNGCGELTETNDEGYCDGCQRVQWAEAKRDALSERVEWQASLLRKGRQLFQKREARGQRLTAEEAVYLVAVRAATEGDVPPVEEGTLRVLGVPARDGAR